MTRPQSYKIVDDAGEIQITESIFYQKFICLFGKDSIFTIKEIS